MFASLVVCVLLLLLLVARQICGRQQAQVQLRALCVRIKANKENHERTSEQHTVRSRALFVVLPANCVCVCVSAQNKPA